LTAPHVRTLHILTLLRRLIPGPIPSNPFSATAESGLHCIGTAGRDGRDNNESGLIACAYV